MGPAFIHSPLLGANGITVDHLIHVTDWLPTFMKAAGATDEEIAAIAMDGIDQWDMIKDPENYVSRREEVVLNINDAPQGNHGPQGAYGKGEYKIVVHPGPQDGWIEPPTGQNLSELRFQCATSFRSFELLNQNQLESNYHKRTDAMSRA